MQKLEGTTFNVVQSNVEKLKELFPDVFTENEVNFDKLRLALGAHVDIKKERYDFTWNGKSQAIQLAQKQTTATLRPNREESVNWDSTKNLYIEGDNLEVLRTIQKSYHSNVKMIYIDPPYNTGQDFIYNDDFRDNIKNYKEKNQENMKANPETKGRYHTDWLNMIYPRLKIARNLLKDDGVIFISIDDHELANLRKVCDEIFGDENFIGIFSVNSTPNARDYGHIGKMHEYVLFYAKNIRETVTNMLPEADKQFKYSDDMGGFNIHPLYNSNVAFNAGNRSNLYYPFYLDPTERTNDGFYNIYLEKRDGLVEVFPPKSVKDGVQFVWRWGREKARLGLNQEIIGYKTNDGEYRIVQKMRHSEKLIRSLLLDKSYTSRRGTAEVENLFNQKVFSFPKPVDLVYTFCSVGTEKDSIVLDFFSGSCTTAHAIMKLNAEDQGNRRFIMVQLDELVDENSSAYKAGYKNICEIGRERIRRAGSKIVDENRDKEGIEELDTGFKAFKLAETNLKIWDEESSNIVMDLLDLVDPVKEGRTQEDVVYEILLKYGIDLVVPIQHSEVAGKTIYSVGTGYLLICLERELTLAHIEVIAKQNPARVVFYDEGFKDDSVRTNAQKILKRFGIEDIRVI
jgi:adenine-specific DNA-methyltransferase